MFDRAELARSFPQRGVGAEIGVLRGQYARSLHDNANPRRLYLVDRWTLNGPGDWPVGTDWEAVLAESKQRFSAGEKVELVVSDSVDWMRAMPDDSLDWIYLDAKHDYESVMAEIHEARRVVKPGGIIAGHDYATNPIDDQGNPYPCGVVQAVTEALTLGYGELMAVTEERIPSWAIRAAKKNPDCQCELAGYCERHSVRKATRMIELCQQRGAYWDAWERGEGPGQNEPAMRREPKLEPAYNHWAPLHYYAVRHAAAWSADRARRWYRIWVATIPNSRGCGCREKWTKLEVPFVFDSPDKFFACSVEGHNKVNLSIGKPTISIAEAKATWWFVPKNS